MSWPFMKLYPPGNSGQRKIAILYNARMPYLIDGHNLIPKLGFDLSSFDDEIALVELLNEFNRLSRTGQIEIYFDNAQPGGREKQRMGMVNAFFIRRPKIADEAIRLRLKQLKKGAKNWSVVSSDNRVQAEARSVGAKVITSDQFARNVREILRAGPVEKNDPAGKTVLSESEVNEWLEVFGEDTKDISKS